MRLDFEHFSIGDIINFEKNFDLKDFKQFAKLSGDFNPLHYDPEYAATYGDNQNIVPIHLIISPLSRIAGMNFPGTPSLYLGHSVRAVNQLKYGETISYSAKIVAINAAKRIMTVKVIGAVGTRIIFDAEIITRAMRSEWDQEIDCNLIKGASKGRVLITGSSGAIGAAIARKFAQERWPLLLQNRSKCGLDDHFPINSDEISLELVEADLSSKEGLKYLLKTIQMLGDISIVIHTASPPLNSTLKNLVDVNYLALKNIVEAVLPQMLKQQHGKILVMGSTAMLSMIEGFADYAAAKSMAASYLQSVDTAFSAYGVNGFVFAPDFVLSPYSEQVRGNSPALLPAEVANKVYETLTSHSSFMTVQHVGSLMEGSYGFLPNARTDTDVPNNTTISKNDDERLLKFDSSDDEMLVRCVRSILPNASYEQIHSGGLGLTPGWDSLAQIQIMLEVEKYFEHKFSSTDFESLKTFNGILKAVNK